MAFSLANAMSGAGGAVADVGSEWGKSIIREGAESRLMEQRGKQETALMQERAKIEDMRIQRERERMKGIGADVIAAQNAPVYDPATDSVSPRPRTFEESQLTAADVYAKHGELSMSQKAREFAQTERGKMDDRIDKRTDKATDNARADRTADQSILESQSRVRFNDGARTTAAESRASGERRAQADIERAANLAASSIGRDLSGRKGEDGQPMYTGQQIAQLRNFAAQAVRAGNDPQTAENIAAQLSDKLLTNADIATKLATEEKKLSRIGTFESGKTGDVKVGDKTMSIEDWRKQRAGELRRDNDAEIAAEASRLGIGGARGGEQAIRVGAVVADARGIADGSEAEKNGKKYVARGGQWVEVKESGNTRDGKTERATQPEPSKQSEPESALIDQGEKLEKSNQELKTLGNLMRFGNPQESGKARAVYLQTVRDLLSGTQSKGLIAPHLLGAR